jgi:hypothetical protein
MSHLNKGGRWQLAFAVLLFIVAERSFFRARTAEANHTLVFFRDRIGGVGDSWMWPGQAYFVAAVCGIVGIWLLIRFFIPRAKP